MEFGLKASPGGASDADIIKDATTATFAKDVHRGLAQRCR